MNRSSGNLELFQDAGDYEAFERVLAEARQREQGMRVCAYILMPNHYHLVLWPALDGQLSRFMQWLAMTHTQRWHAHRHSAGRGHLYQSRFKSFPIQQDHHFLSVCRYVERNALRANLVERAEAWRYSSLACRHGKLPLAAKLLDEWPVPRPSGWLSRVNRPQSAKELDALRRSVLRGRPYGADDWALRAAAKLGLESSFRPVGRPRVAQEVA
jgi:putative transposase